ncbi:hypothetical protein D1AOALGA4SA_6481 [Olavius algarvensis Delta 1 endosymbiont]|nr:hypothetical protein D1AOALGA4SA_6481 [Olavius algarvensis Delta 1 endosymbiont]
MLDCWIVGLLAESLMSSFNTAALQHSNTPRLRLFNKFYQS